MSGGAPPRALLVSVLSFAVLTGALPACSAADASSPIVIDVEPTATSTEAVATSRPAPDPATPRPVEGTIAWNTDLAAAFEQSRATGKPLFVYVRASWATPSLAMERSALKSPEVARALRPFIAVYVDLADDEVVAEAGTRLGDSLNYLPVVVLLDVASGRKATLAGASDADQLVEHLGAFVSEPR